MSGGGSGSSGYEYKPYSGARPSSIDANGKEYLRPTQDLTQQIIMDRAQGIGVGYDPSWMKLNEDILRSNSDRSLQDTLRTQKGALSSAGLSGNPRAYEATAGRAMRNSNEDMTNAMKALATSDMERKNTERDVNTQRLQNLNTFNFGQENKVADFDLSTYLGEEANRARSYGLDFDTTQYNNERSDDFVNDLVGTGLTLADIYGTSQGLPPGTVSSAASLARTSGGGIQPTTQGMYNKPLNYKSSRALMR